MLAPAMETRRVSCFTRGRGLICKIIPQQHAAMVVDEPGRAIRIREMHQVPQLDVPVTHTRFIGYDPVQHPAVVSRHKSSGTLRGLQRISQNAIRTTRTLKPTVLQTSPCNLSKKKCTWCILPLANYTK